MRGKGGWGPRQPLMAIAAEHRKPHGAMIGIFRHLHLRLVTGDTRRGQPEKTTLLLRAVATAAIDRSVPAAERKHRRSMGKFHSGPPAFIVAFLTR